MKEMMKRASVLVLVLVLAAGSLSSAIPIQPKADDSTEYIQFLLNLVDTYYVNETTDEELLEGAYKGIFEQLDPHSVYFTPEEYARFNEDSDGTFGGIGISVSKDKESDYIKIVSPIEDTPGDRAGLRSNDLIVSVDGMSLKGMSLEESVNILRGEPGTTITLGIQRDGQSGILQVVITRELIVVKSVKYELLDNKIGFLRLTQFGESTADEALEALLILESKGMEKLIIDLRNNPGGRLDVVVDIADYLLEKDDNIVQIDYRAYPDILEKSGKDPKVILPMVVLVNEGSASASEILAGALQDNKAATVIGTQTFGKGTVQSLMPLSNGGGVKITVAEYFTADRNQVDKVGITPDIIVEDLSDVDIIELQSYAPMIENETNILGDRGLNVYGAQQRLVELGYEVAIDGMFGSQTLKALESFQRANGLDPSGQLDFFTRGALHEAIMDKMSDSQTDIILKEAIDFLIDGE